MGTEKPPRAQGLPGPIGLAEAPKRRGEFDSRSSGARRDAEQDALKDLGDLQQEGVRVVWPRTRGKLTHECPQPEPPAGRNISSESVGCEIDQEALND